MASKSSGKEQLTLKNTKNISNRRTSVKSKTPLKNIVAGFDRKKTRSSMKKIKTFLRSHSKKKTALSRSPSLSKVKLSLNGFEQRMKSSESEDQLNVITRSVKLPVSSSNYVKQLKPLTRSSSSFVNQQPMKRRSQSMAVDVLPSEALMSADASNKVSAKNCSAVTVTEDGVIKSTRNEFTDADKLFAYMIEPVMPPKFFKDIWEKKPLLIRRHSSQYNESWFSTEELDRILREERVNFTDNVDVVTYTNGKRETHNPTGRAYAPVVWDFYQNGCSVRLLNPHTYTQTVWNYLSLLQHYFGCVAGANVYLTPPGSQGFAPHWDDIEAFVLQLEGKKHWRVYEPRSENEVLPRFSSANFSDADLLSPPVLDAVLEPGDLLYFPRGYIHQAFTMEESHSLHITVSVGQKNTWGDFLEKLLPRALEIAMEDDVEFRQSLPQDWLNYMGVSYSDEENIERSRFQKTVQKLVTKLMSFAPVDAACDQMAKQFLQNCLPPVLTDDEKRCSVHGHGEHWNPQDCRVRGAVEMDPDTEIRVIRKGVLRLVMEDDKVFVYHNLENSRMLHGTELQCIEVEPPMAEGVEFLLKHYPDYIAVDDLPLDTVQERITLALSLYDRGLIMTRVPMESLSDDDDDSCDTMSQSTVDSDGET